MRECELCGKPLGGMFVTVVGSEVCVECFFDESIPAPHVKEERRKAIQRRAEKIAKELGK